MSFHRDDEDYGHSMLGDSVKLAVLFLFSIWNISDFFKKYILHAMKSYWNHDLFRQHVFWLMSHFSLCLCALLPTLWPLPRWSQPQSHWFPSLLECEWFAVLDILSGPNRSASHVSHAAAVNPSGIDSLLSWTLSFITSTQKVPVGQCFYMRGIVLFLLAKQLLLTAFPLQTCLTRLPQQTVEQLHCNQSNIIYMTSSGSPQQIPPLPPLFGFTY